MNAVQLHNKSYYTSPTNMSQFHRFLAHIAATLQIWEPKYNSNIQCPIHLFLRSNSINQWMYTTFFAVIACNGHCTIDITISMECTRTRIVRLRRICFPASTTALSQWDTCFYSAFNITRCCSDLSLTPRCKLLWRWWWYVYHSWLVESTVNHKREINVQRLPLTSHRRNSTSKANSRAQHNYTHYHTSRVKAFSAFQCRREYVKKRTAALITSKEYI